MGALFLGRLAIVAVVEGFGLLLEVGEEFEHPLGGGYRCVEPLRVEARLHLALEGDDGSVEVVEAFRLAEAVELPDDAVKFRHPFLRLVNADEKRPYLSLNTQGLRFLAVFLERIAQLGGPVQRLLVV